jgi:YbgC/YbaW family acyl-CoA thioester hydrolase
LNLNETNKDRVMALRGNFRFSHRLRVRWSEVDLQQIVFNGHYLNYFDTAVADYWRAMALPYQAAMARLGGDLYVRKATLDYLGSARFDDLLDVAIRCEQVGNTSLRLRCAVFRGEKLLVTGELVYVFADPATQSSRPVPPELREMLLDFEAGAEMLDVQVGHWDELGVSAQDVRAEVFVREQGIPLDLELDEADHSAVHALALNRLGMPLATGRLLQHAPGVARLGRMAVIAPMRGSSVGRQILEALIAAAAARGDHTVVAHAQSSAVNFYRRFGFAEHGPHFEEAGIVHVEMVRAISPPVPVAVPA